MKEKLRGFFFSNPVLKKIYCTGSYVKGRIRCNKVLIAPIRKFRKSVSDGVFLVFTPEHANLGDHAIALAETRLLRQRNIPFLEITGAQLFELSQYGFLDTMNGFPIFINGGGNLGTLWPDIEEMIRLIIKKNPDSPITIFPSTIYYAPDVQGEQQFACSKEIYNGHRDLVIYARENLSYETMKDAYRDVRLMPDMVLSLDEQRAGTRQGCILCLRDDVEQTLNATQQEQIKEVTKTLFCGNVKEINTVREENVPVLQREQALRQIFDAFGSTELVITDRLHGMIFCAVTGTKCVVLDSRSPKMRGCYEWIRHLPYILFAERPEAIPELYAKLANEEGTYSTKPFEEYFARLSEEICCRAKHREGRHV